jgi:hypothetical protein
MNANQQTELAARIQAACDSTEPKTKARNKALAAVKWTLKVAGISNDVYVMETTSAFQTEYLTDDLAKAVKFDGRDNEERKIQFFEALLGEKLELAMI